MSVRIELNHLYIDTKALERAEGEDIHIVIYSEKGELIVDSELRLISSRSSSLIISKH